MKNTQKLILVIILLITHFLIGLNTIPRLSPTYDEPLHLTAGYSYWKTGQYYLNIYDHPPLAEMIGAIPLIFQNPVLLIQHPSWANYRQYSFANLFLYQNKISPEKMLNPGRIIILVFSCMLGFFIFKWSSALSGYLAGLVSLIFYVFSSAFISNGTLVTTDLIMVLFFYLSFYTFWNWLNNQSLRNAILTGLCFGLTLCSKFSAIILPGIFLIQYFLFYIYNRKNCPVNRFIAHIFIVLGISALTILAVYRFNSISLFFDGLSRTLARLENGRSSFLFGQYSTTGWWYYFILVFLIKTPVSLLLAFFTAIILRLKQKFNNNFYNLKTNPVLFLLIPVLIYFLIASASKTQIGFRHILPVYPFILIIAGSIAAYNRIYKYLLIPVMIWYIFACYKIHPWHISYFNEFIGGSKNGYKYLTDSNIDWGQGLKQFTIDLQKEYPGTAQTPLFFCYFGVGDPHFYGIKYAPIGFIDNLDPAERAGDRDLVISTKKLNRVIFAISVTNLQATYYSDKKIFSWLKDIPFKQTAYSIHLYDLTGNKKAINQLKTLLIMSGNKDLIGFIS